MEDKFYYIYAKSMCMFLTGDSSEILHTFDVLCGVKFSVFFCLYDKRGHTTGM